MDWLQFTLAVLDTLKWPLVAVIVIIAVRPIIAQYLPRMDKLSVSYKDKGFALQLERLHEGAQQVAKDVAPKIESSDAKQNLHYASTEGLDATIKTVIGEASSAPEAALLGLSFALESKAAKILAASNWDRGQPMSLTDAVKLLIEYQQLPASAQGSFQLFSDVRNRILHSTAKIDDRDIFSAIDSGITLLKSLYAIPLETNTVSDPGVSIYSDDKCETLIKGAKGLMLKSVSPGGTHSSVRIYPTTRNDYMVGEQVEWRWNMSRIFGAAWYRDPNTQEIAKGWDSSAEFIGGDLSKVGPQ